MIDQYQPNFELTIGVKSGHSCIVQHLSLRARWLNPPRPDRTAASGLCIREGAVDGHS